MHTYLQSARKQFEYYKSVGERAMAQVNDGALFWQQNAECNSIATIIKHLQGNMLSRWTDFLTTDGEKPWRQRDAEFESDTHSREDLLTKWNEGWICLFDALDSVNESNWHNDIFIRGEKHTVVDAINRQLAHIPYHVGQIVFIDKLHAGEDWASLTVPRGKSAEFNVQKFAEEAAKKTS
ncbi:DUF1572 family protein [Mucilaginibacter psychrotolerans]|uniref:DUF1572 domain-containing protein n=1 Tax=Mucilaginibacter psychrotolerans TaxID=1524096 RepID=A0A4Y8S4Y8_9SPHI|nr:DUF1572 family protein [Mucilaginibacter psychrotolerans]TFF34023.1 DUF1572 domain-containing protein [Mucilaginibacter psychrotolerans]